MVTMCLWKKYLFFASGGIFQSRLLGTSMAKVVGNLFSKLVHKSNQEFQTNRVESHNHHIDNGR